MPEICFQKAPGQDLAQKGRFPLILEKEFNSWWKGRQMPEICLQKAPGQFSIEISSVLGHENFRFVKIYLVLGK